MGGMGAKGKNFYVESAARFGHGETAQRVQELFMAGDRAGAAQKEQPILAPMPGRVVRILVAPGDEVAARQPVVVVEAMKMQNELRAPRDGVVSTVNVGTDQTLEVGDLLVVLK